MAETVAEYFAQLSKEIDTEKVKDITATFQWDITGEGGGKWNVKLDGGKVEIAQGEIDNPNITIIVSAENWLAVASGKLNGKMAFLTGKVKIRGNMTLAMKLQALMGDALQGREKR